MKLAIQYLNDAKGNVKAIQLPLLEWEKILSELNKAKQLLKIKSDIEEAMKQVVALKKAKTKKKTLSDFIDEL